MSAVGKVYGICRAAQSLRLLNKQQQKQKEAHILEEKVLYFIEEDRVCTFFGSLFNTGGILHVTRSDYEPWMAH